MAKKIRILDANKHLPFFLKEGENFYVGLLFEDFIKNDSLKKYNLAYTFSNNLKIVPKENGSTTRYNVKGKFVRKQPEEKITKTIHLNYFRRDGTHIEYDRDYSVYAKELAHKFNISLNYKTNKHGQKVIVSELLKYNNDSQNIIKNTHVINIFCEISNDFEIFNTELEPAIDFNQKFEKDILPQGNLSDPKTMDDLSEFANRYTKNKDDQNAFQKRLHILKNYYPDIRGKGPNNFFGYIVFGFKDLGIVILETMYAGNATYVFKLTDYESNIIKDKQTVINNRQMLRRFFHYEDWENKITTYLNDLINKSNNKEHENK